MHDLRRLLFFGMLPALMLLCSGGLAALLPEDVLWWNAAKALLLTGMRWMPLGWVIWALWAARRLGPKPGLLVVGLLGLGLVGLPPLDRVEGEGLLVVSANVQAYSERVPELEAALAALNADVLLTIEQRGAQVRGLKRVSDNFDRKLPRPSHGTALWCREGLACQGEITEEIGPPGCSMPMGILRVDQRLCVVSMHAPPPVPVCAQGLHPYLEELASHLAQGRVRGAWGPCADGDPTLVMGDLNYVPGSEAYRLLRSRGMGDPLHSRGIWAATWPTGGGWPNLPFFRLDHVFVGDLEVEGVRLLRLPDTDHKAIRLRVR